MSHLFWRGFLKKIADSFSLIEDEDTEGKQIKKVKGNGHGGTLIIQGCKSHENGLKKYFSSTKINLVFRMEGYSFGG